MRFSLSVHPCPQIHPMKVANVQVYEACDRSEFVEVSDAEIEELRKWKAYPFKNGLKTLATRATSEKSTTLNAICST